jgi:cytochrome c-type biogenesis protein CcsB
VTVAINETYALVSNDFVYGAMGAYTVSLFAFAGSFATGRNRSDVSVSVRSGGVALAERPSAEPGRRLGNIGLSTMWLGTAMLAVGVVLRGLSAGRVTWGNMYEFAITGALGVALAYLVMSLKRDVRWLGLFIVTPVLLTLGAAITVFYVDSAQLIPALRSYWLVIHVGAAVICAGAFTAGAALTILHMIVEKVDARVAAGEAPGRFAEIARRVPNAKALDAFAYRVHAFAFPLWTFTVIAGAIWARHAWSRYWGWDPKETWSFITWVCYAAYLHARATAGWKGVKSGTIALIAYGTFLFNFVLVNLLFAGLHTYSGK